MSAAKGEWEGGRVAGRKRISLFLEAIPDRTAGKSGNIDADGRTKEEGHSIEYFYMYEIFIPAMRLVRGRASSFVSSFFPPPPVALPTLARRRDEVSRERSAKTFPVAFIVGGEASYASEVNLRRFTPRSSLHRSFETVLFFLSFPSYFFFFFFWSMVSSTRSPAGFTNCSRRGTW